MLGPPGAPASFAFRMKKNMMVLSGSPDGFIPESLGWNTLLEDLAYHMGRGLAPFQAYPQEFLCEMVYWLAKVCNPLG